MNRLFTTLHQQMFDSSQNMRYNIEDGEYFCQLIVKECAKYLVNRDIDKDIAYSSDQVAEHYKMIYSTAKFNMALELLELFGVDNEHR